jgi:hypothetical protein
MLFGLGTGEKMPKAVKWALSFLLTMAFMIFGFILIATGGTCTPPEPPKFEEGQLVKLKLDGRPVIIWKVQETCTGSGPMWLYTGTVDEDGRLENHLFLEFLLIE